jgi:hypothetical protein
VPLGKVYNSVADPHPESAFQMRMQIRDKLRKNSANDKKKLKFLNISLVYFKGKVQREFSSVF